MKHIKLFEELNIGKKDFPEDGYGLNPREKQILVDLVGFSFLSDFEIKKEDNYYYTYHDFYYNQFDGFNELKDYILFCYYIDKKENNKIIDLLKSTDLDPSFENNLLIRWASYFGHLGIVKILLQDPRVDPSVNNNDPIMWAISGRLWEIVKLLIKDPRVDPSYFDNYFIKWAVGEGHSELVKQLIKDPRVRARLTTKEIKEYEAY